MTRKKRPNLERFAKSRFIWKLLGCCGLPLALVELTPAKGGHRTFDLPAPIGELEIGADFALHPLSGRGLMLDVSLAFAIVDHIQT